MTYRNTVWGLVLLIIVSVGIVISILYISEIIILSPTVTDTIDETLYNTIPDLTKCSFAGANPFTVSRDRTIFRDLPALAHTSQANEGHIFVFGSSNARQGLFNFQLHDSPIVNLTLGGSSPIEYEAIINYLDNNDQVFHPNRGQSSVVIFTWSRIFVEGINSDYSKIFTQYNQYYFRVEQSGQLAISDRSSLIGKFQIMRDTQHNFYTEYFPFWLQMQLFSSSSIQSALVLPNCRLTETVGEQYNNQVDAFIDTQHQNFILPNQYTEALERIARKLETEDVPLIIIHAPVYSAVRNSKYNREYREYMEDFASQYNVAVYDFSELLADKYYRDWAHMTVEGQAVFYQAFQSILQKEGLIP